jgi:hypothetical protein
VLLLPVEMEPEHTCETKCEPTYEYSSADVQDRTEDGDCVRDHKRDDPETRPDPNPQSPSESVVYVDLVRLSVAHDCDICQKHGKNLSVFT